MQNRGIRIGHKMSINSLKIAIQNAKNITHEDIDFLEKTPPKEVEH